jgi:hypothetical protein
MNWKYVLYLLRVERKSGRLVRGVKATGYRESGVLAYWPYWLAAIIGVAGGLLGNLVTSGVYSAPPVIPGLPTLGEAAMSFFVSMPTLILILALVFTMFQQIQLSGIKRSSQIMYWLPLTWQEHTLASILANLLGLPIALAIGFSGGILVFSLLNGLIVEGLLTTVALFAAAFIGSATTEIARVVQVRFTGAVYKSSGRAAIWVRLIGSLLFFLALYLVWFSLVSGAGSIGFIQTIAASQSSLWVIPFVWLGIALYYLFSSNLLLGVAFVVASTLFMVGLYFLAILLNQRFGLYEPPAIKVQASGEYKAKTGVLGKFGFTSVEAALIRKDIRSFTRRRELIGVFIVPIVFMIVPIFNSMNISNQGAPGEVNLMFEAMMFLFPAAIMAMTLGNMLIGEEGPAVWRIYASPITAKSLVKSKFAFLTFLSTVILLMTSTVGVVFFNPSVKMVAVALLEGAFLTFALGSMGLTFGFKGADFSASRRQRMIRQEWALISLFACALAGLVIISPIIVYVLPLLELPFLSLAPLGLDMLAILVIISGVLAALFTVVFYKINIGSAAELLRKAEI